MGIRKRELKTIDPITRKPKVVYQVRVEGPRHPLTGKRQTWSKQVSSFDEARKLNRRWEAEIERGTAVVPAATTIAELLDLWLASKRREITPQSAVDYETTIRLHLKPAFGSIRVQSLNAPQIEAQYASWQAAGRSSRVIRGCHMRLSQALDYAVRMGLVQSNISRSCTPPRLEERKHTVWNAVEASAYLAESNRSEYHPLWHLLLLEGMRRGEALGLRWSDINWERRTAHITQQVANDKTDRGAPVVLSRTKTAGSSRAVALSSHTFEALKAHRKVWLAKKLAAPAWEETDLIICTDDGRPINPNNVGRAHALITKWAGVPLIRVHDLRHTHATLLLLEGIQPKIVSERLGHAKVEITLNLYSHVLPDMQSEAAAAIDRLLPPKADALVKKPSAP